MSPVMLLMLLMLLMLVVVVAPGALATLTCGSMGPLRDIPVVEEDPVTYAQKETDELQESTTMLEATAATEAATRMMEPTNPPQADAENVEMKGTDELQETTTTLEVTAATEAAPCMIEPTNPPQADADNVEMPQKDEMRETESRYAAGAVIVALIAEAGIAGVPLSIEPMVPPKACTAHIHMAHSYDGRCVMVNRNYSACHADNYLTAEHTSCPQLPPLHNSTQPGH